MGLKPTEALPPVVAEPAGADEPAHREVGECREGEAHPERRQPRGRELDLLRPPIPGQQGGAAVILHGNHARLVASVLLFALLLLQKPRRGRRGARNTPFSKFNPPLVYGASADPPLCGVVVHPGLFQHLCASTPTAIINTITKATKTATNVSSKPYSFQMLIDQAKEENK